MGSASGTEEEAEVSGIGIENNCKEHVSESVCNQQAKAFFHLTAWSFSRVSGNKA